MRAVPDVLAAHQNVAGVRPADSLQFSHRIRLLILIEWQPARAHLKWCLLGPSE
jgi:hypothetical protein